MMRLRLIMIRVAAPPRVASSIYPLSLIPSYQISILLNLGLSCDTTSRICGDSAALRVCFELQQIPQIPIEILENGDRAIAFLFGLPDKHDSPALVQVEVPPEVIRMEE